MRGCADRAREQPLPVEAGQHRALVGCQQRGVASPCDVALGLVDVDDVRRARRGVSDLELRPPGLDVPGVVDTALDPGPADPHCAGARQPAELGGMAGAEHQAVEPVGAGDEGVLHLVGAVDHAVAGPQLVHLLVLPGQTGAAQHVVDLLGRAVGVGRRGQPAGSDPHPVDPDADRAGRLAELLPGGVHLALGGAMPLDVVPVNDPHGRHSTRGIRSHTVSRSWIQTRLCWLHTIDRRRPL